MPTAYFPLIAGGLVLFHLWWMAHFFLAVFQDQPAHLRWWRRLLQTCVRARHGTTAELESGGTASSAAHAEIVSLSDRQLDTTIVGGSVALAAWSQIFVSSGSGPAATISGVTLGLLFFGSLVSMTFPILFRVSGLHLTYIGREFASSVGFGSIALALCSAVSDILTGWPVVGASLLAGALLIRHGFDVRQQMKLTA